MENGIPQRTRKRAPRCKVLDNPLIRKEIEFRYGVEGRKLDEVVEEINKAYGLSATKHQYKERLSKWGCKQRLNHKEYQKVHALVATRRTLNKESKVFLKSSERRVLPEKRLQRWTARNITFTDQIMSKAKNTTLVGLGTHFSPRTLNRHETYGEVQTPSPNPETWSLPIIKKTVAIYYPHIPIGQLYGYLQQILPRNLWHPEDTGSALSAQQSLPHLPLLGNIIYQISNQLIHGCKHLYTLLDQVNEHGFRMQLKKLLSIKSPSILATCSALLDPFYFRRDDEMLNNILSNHPQLKRGLYHYLEKFMSDADDLPQFAGGRLLKDILDEISNLELCPESAEDAYTLLVACKHNSDDLGVFQRLWDPKKIKLQELERISRIYTNVEEQLLYSRNSGQLKSLLECGFTSFIFNILFQVIILGDQNSMRVLCERVGIKYRTDVFYASAEQNNVWEVLDKDAFYSILSVCMTEISGAIWGKRKGRGIKGPEISLDIYVLMYAACIEPRITKYAVEIIQWKHSVSAVDAARMAINALPILEWRSTLASPYEYWRIFPASALEHTATKRLSVLETLLCFGVDPNETSFWRISLWEEIIDRIGPPQETILLFELFLDSGADVNVRLGPEISQLIISRLSSRPGAIDYFSSHEIYTPIEIAFGLEASSMFCLLLERHTLLHQSYDWLTSGDYGGVHPEFIRAVQERDRAAIEDLWDQRTLKLAISKAIKTRNFDAARNILLTYTRELRLSSLFRDVVNLCFLDPNSYTDFSDFVSLLFGESLEFAFGPSTKTSDGHDDNWMLGYSALLEGAIWSVGLKALELLFSHYPTVAKLSNTTLYSNSPYRLHEHKIFLVHTAAKYSLDCLKFLISQEACIDEAEIETSEHRAIYYTALYRAIENGCIETVAYILSQGGNVYAPCGDRSSAIEYAISEGRIDLLALILEAVPNSYPLALELAESDRYKDEYIAEYVRTWKPANIGTDMGGKIVDFTSGGLVLGAAIGY
ncbi:hypothetical protein TWF102_011844 [Orbilia oligospora]|uniref:Clr5 domain-containing protein n=1 Tax=Orbilia oligospora TaxID=2813651 RepID=A0A7C8N1A0_ORBOL|nr:hypothetical protein TWF102_011844 [Orbilia oligospora]KAF3115615.1 hypothetical protein TWF706_005731 [Orbilia oligospora]